MHEHYLKSFLSRCLQFFELDTYVFPFTNETQIRETALRLHPDYEHYYTFWSKMIVMEMMPYATLIVLNAVIVWKIAKSRYVHRMGPCGRKKVVHPVVSFCTGTLDATLMAP